MFIAVMTWRDSRNELHSQAFGSWISQDDGSHHDAITAWLQQWSNQAEADGNVLVNATLHLVTPVEH